MRSAFGVLFIFCLFIQVLIQFININQAEPLFCTFSCKVVIISKRIEKNNAIVFYLVKINFHGFKKNDNYKLKSWPAYFQTQGVKYSVSNINPSSTITVRLKVVLMMKDRVQVLFLLFVVVWSLSHVQLSVTPWTACQPASL